MDLNGPIDETPKKHLCRVNCQFGYVGRAISWSLYCLHAVYGTIICNFMQCMVYTLQIFTGLPACMARICIHAYSWISMSMYICMRGAGVIFKIMYPPLIVVSVDKRSRNRTAIRPIYYKKCGCIQRICTVCLKSVIRVVSSCYFSGSSYFVSGVLCVFYVVFVTFVVMCSAVLVLWKIGCMYVSFLADMILYFSCTLLIMYPYVSFPR